MSISQITAETNERMTRSIENLKKEFSRVRTGRATPALLDGIKVDYYGTPTPLAQLGNISTPEPRQLIIQPWEKTLLSAIEKAILASDLGINPQNDGNVVRLNMPELTEERRRDLVKNSKKLAEDDKVAVRNIRRDSNEKIKKLEKDKELSLDDSKKSQDDIQKITDKYIKLIDDMLAVKEKEILEV